MFPLGLALASSLLTLVLGYISYVTVQDVIPPDWLSIWKRWDTLHYLAIASGGYSGHAVNICFLPGYPLCIWALTPFLRNPMLAALIVSNAAFAAGLVLLYKIVRLDFDERAARTAVLFCVCFPTAYFFHIGYTESLYLALSLGSFYMGRKNRWFLAGFLGFLAALTRLPGFVLSLVLAVEYLEQRHFRFRQIRWDAICLFLPVLGLGVYLAINWITCNSPFQFLETYNALFGRKLSFPVMGFLDSWREIATATPTKRFTLGGENLLFFFVSSAALIWSMFKLRKSYAAYSLMLWIFLFCMNFWISVPRHLMVSFPLFIFCGVVVGRRPVLRASLLFISVFLYALGTIQFVRGWWSH